MLMELLAVADDITPVGPDVTTDTSLFSLDPFFVELILGSIIPFVVAFLAGATTPAWMKKVGTLVLSAISGLITVSLVDGGGATFSQSAIKAAALTLISAMVAYWVTLRNSSVEASLLNTGLQIGATSDGPNP